MALYRAVFLFYGMFRWHALWADAFSPPTNHLMKFTFFSGRSSIICSSMKRPLLDQIATTLFKLEEARVEASSEVDEKGRNGEPMKWSEDDSMANRLSQIVAGNDLGYQFKQFVANIVAGDFDEEATVNTVTNFVASNKVAMFSFTSCPFCRRAKDYLDDNNIPYTAMELDELDDNQGNEIRAILGKMYRRTSMPSIFIRGEFIGGCNDGPGLLPLAKSGKLKELLAKQ